MKVELRPGIIFYAAGKVVHGFGRGSKQLGIPTANLEEAVVEKLPTSIKSGVYFGWAKVEGHPVYKTVVSIGWNPFFQNSKRSIEAHLLHEFLKDFYGSQMQLIILKYHRPEKGFDNLESLIACIHSDIDKANQYLDQEKALKWSNPVWFEPTKVPKVPSGL